MDDRSIPRPAAGGRGTGWAGQLLQRLRRAQPLPAPFRESDFEPSEWRSSALDAPPGAEPEGVSRAGR